MVAPGGEASGRNVAGRRLPGMPAREFGQGRGPPRGRPTGLELVEVHA